MEGTLLSGTQSMVSTLADGVVATPDDVPTRFANVAPALFGDAVDVPVGIWIGLRAARSRLEFEQSKDPFLPFSSLADGGELVGRLTLGAWSSGDAAVSMGSAPNSLVEAGAVWFGAPRGVSGPIMFCKRCDVFFRPDRADGSGSTGSSHNQCNSESSSEAASLLVSLGDPVIGLRSRIVGAMSAGEYAELVAGLPISALVDRLQHSGDDVAAQWLRYKNAHDPAFQALSQSIGKTDWSWRDSLTAKLQLCLAIAAEARRAPVDVLAPEDLLKRVRVSLASEPHRGDEPWRFSLSIEPARPIVAVEMPAAISSFKGLFSIVGVDEAPAGTMLRVSVKAASEWTKALELGRTLVLHFSAAEGFVYPLDVSLELDHQDGEQVLLKGVLGNVPAVAITQMRILRHLRDLEMAFTVTVPPAAVPVQAAPTMAALAEVFLVVLFAVPTRSATQICAALASVTVRCRESGFNVDQVVHAVTAESAFSIQDLSPGFKKQTDSLFVSIREMAANMLVDKGGYASPMDGGLDVVIADLERILGAVKQTAAAAVLGAHAAVPVEGDEAFTDVLASLISDAHWLEKALAIDQIRAVTPKPLEKALTMDLVPSVAAKLVAPKVAPPIVQPVAVKPAPVAPKPVTTAREALEELDLGATMVVSHEQIRKAFKDERLTPPGVATTKAAPPKPDAAKETAPPPLHERSLDDTMIVAPGWRPEPRK